MSGGNPTARIRPSSRGERNPARDLRRVIAHVAQDELVEVAEIHEARHQGGGHVGPRVVDPERRCPRRRAGRFEVEGQCVRATLASEMPAGRPKPFCFGPHSRGILFAATPDDGTEESIAGRVERGGMKHVSPRTRSIYWRARGTVGLPCDSLRRPPGAMGDRGQASGRPDGWRDRHPVGRGGRRCRSLTMRSSSRFVVGRDAPTQIPGSSGPAVSGSPTASYVSKQFAHAGGPDVLDEPIDHHETGLAAPDPIGRPTPRTAGPSGTDRGLDRQQDGTGPRIGRPTGSIREGFIVVPTGALGLSPRVACPSCVGDVPYPCKRPADRRAGPRFGRPMI